MKLILSDKVYNVLKWTAVIFLPALSVLLVSLQKAWGWDIPINAIAETLAAIEVFIGALIAVSTYQYNKEEKQS